MESDGFSQKKSLHLRLGIVSCLFTITGATALVSEQVFEKLLSTVVGASTPASAIVLAVFFLGLTVGGALYGLLSPLLRRPLLLYGALEGFVGVWSLLLALFFDQIQAFSGALIRLAGGSAAVVFFLRFFVASVWILPPTVAAGSTFPAVVGVLQQFRLRRAPKLFSRFYTFNLLGAVIGAAAAPFILFPRYGLIVTLWIVAAAQFVVSVVAYKIAARVGPRRRPLPDSERQVSIRRRLGALLLRPGGALLLALAFFSGFQFFSLEVLWVHLIGAVLGMSVYAFGIMLTVVLAGLFLGGCVSSVIFGGRKAIPGWVLPVLITLSAATLSFTFAGWDDAPALLGRWGAGLTTFREGELLRFLVAAALIGPCATLLGTIYPLIFRLPSFPKEEADATAGLLGAVNAVGCVLGALATGFFLLPALGSEAVYRVLTFLTALLALAFVISEWSRHRTRSYPPSRKVLLASVLVAALLVANVIALAPRWDPLALTSGVNVYFRPLHVRQGSKLLFWHEDAFGGFTTVVENSFPDPASGKPVRILLTNGKFEGNDGGEMPAQIGFALIPILHQAHLNHALVIGLGTGHTAHVVAASGYRSVDVAEIAPGIVEAARRFFRHANRDVLEAPNVALALEDGRNFLLRAEKKYDLISIELDSVWFAGASNLYSQEFYDLARKRLTPDGVLQQWIQFHHIRPADVVSAIATLRSVFDHVTLWYLGEQGILVASPSRLQFNRGLLADLRRLPALAQDLETLGSGTGFEIEKIPRSLLLNEEETDRVALAAVRKGIPLNTDRNRFLEYSTPRYNLERKDHAAEVLRVLLGFVNPAERRERAAATGLTPILR